MKTFKTGAVRDTGGKGRMDLLPMCALIRVSKHMEDTVSPDPKTGEPHYPERNWEKGLPMHTMIDSAFRHLAKYMDGQDDEDHLCAAATNLLMAMWTEEKHPEMVDIPKRSATSRDTEPDETTKDNGLCENFHVTSGRHECWATKNCSICECNGDRSKCTYYSDDEYPPDYE